MKSAKIIVIDLGNFPTTMARMDIGINDFRNKKFTNYFLGFFNLIVIICDSLSLFG